MIKDLVSIITPCYNGEKYLDRYFNSIIAQTYRPLELIFVNDGSTDKTEDIVKKYEKVLENKGIKLIYIYQENAGQAAALNRGLKYFNGEFLTWPDSDDEMLPKCIEKKVEALKSDQDKDICICKVAIVDEKTPSIVSNVYERKEKDDKELFQDFLLVKNVFYVPGGYMIKTRKFDEIIPNREIYTGRGGQNAQILIPYIWSTKCMYIDEILFKYYVRSDSHSHSIDSSIKIISQTELFEKILYETINNITDMNISYKKMCVDYLKVHYGKQKYGNAIDTKSSKLIGKYYKLLKELKCVSIKEWLLYVKYTKLYKKY